ncbi:MAG: Rieske 2Fe-2S domain-containing protein [Burkholderiaceae bacterium]
MCAPHALVEGGDGVRFEVETPQGRRPAFAIRFDGRVRAYLNQCSHVAIELDWIEGQFFHDDTRYLICATHGALYDSATGACAGGPCSGRGLTALAADERADGIYVQGANPRELHE